MHLIMGEKMKMHMESKTNKNIAFLEGFSWVVKFDCEPNFRRTKSALIEVVVYVLP